MKLNIEDMSFLVRTTSRMTLIKNKHGIDMNEEHMLEQVVFDYIGDGINPKILSIIEEGK